MAHCTENIEADFMQHLAETLPPAKIDQLRTCYTIINTYCMRNNILRKPLLQVTDLETIKAVQSKIENSRAFQSQYADDLPLFVDACWYYFSYVRSRQLADTNEAAHMPETQDEPAFVPIPPSQHRASSPLHKEKTLLTIDFQKVYDLTGSNPKALTYCNKALPFGDTWTDLYVRVVMQLCKEHPQRLQPGLSFSKGHPHVELGDAADAAGMQKPRAIPGTDLVLETKLTANEMLARIKYLMELCQMPYTDVVIQYKKLTTPGQTTFSPASLDPAHVKAILQQHFPYGFCTDSAAEMIQFRAYYAAAYTDPLPYTDGKILSVIRKLCILRRKVAYLPNTVSTVAHSPTFDDLLQEDRYADLRHALVTKNITTIEALRSINLWSFMNEHNLYPIQQRLAISTELTKILQHRGAADAELPRYTLHAGDALYTGSTPSEAFVAFLTAVTAKYPLKFRNLIGLPHPADGKIVLHRRNPAGNRLKLLNPEVFVDSDLSCTQIELYIPWICSRCGTDTTFSIEVCPQVAEPTVTQNHTLPKEPIEKSTPVLPAAPQMATAPSKTVSSTENMLIQSLSQRAEQYLLTRELDGTTYEELQTHLRCSIPQTKTVVADSSHIIEMNRRLYHDEAFVDLDEGADIVADILERLLKKHGVATATQLWEYAQSEMSMFLNDNDITDKQAVYDLARHLFEKIGYRGKHYVFNNNMYISLPEDSVDSCSSILQKYARDKGTVVTYQELEEHIQRLGVNTGNLRTLLRAEKDPAFLLYAENEYLLTALLHIDEAFLEEIQAALSHLFADVGDHIILRQIAEHWYTLLPTLPDALTWTPLLLQQMLRYYPKKLGARTIQAMDSQNSNTLHAMVVQSDSWIQDFRDAVAVYLHDEWPDKQSFYAEELRRLLVDAGMVSGNELYNNMPKALGGDPRFLWNRDGDMVTVRL